MIKSTQRKAVRLSAVLAGLALALGAAAQTPAPSTANARASTGANSKVTHADRSFVEKAAMGGMTEVELGKLAQQKASSDQVKQFGSRMVQDHSKANEELKQIASANGIQLPTTLDRKHRSDVDRFRKLAGADFDKAYMDHMVDDHKKDVSDFRKEASSGKDADIKSFASKTLPVLEQHLQLAEQTREAVASR